MAERSTVTPARQTRTAALSAILFVAVFAGYARAEECFCLLHATGAVLHGCEAFKKENDLYFTAYCTDPQTSVESKQKITSDWQRIAAGADGCNPCRLRRQEETSELRGQVTPPTADKAQP